MMNTVIENKPLKAKYCVEGANSELECVMAGEILVKLYNVTCNHVNNGGIEKFNSDWKESHGDDYDQDEYIEAYERYFKEIADMYSELVRTGGMTIKLRENEPVLLNYKEGYCEIHGYIERL